jgi:uncharacterized protein (TIGR02466 family)
MKFTTHKIFPETLFIYKLNNEKKEENFVKKFKFSETKPFEKDKGGNENCFLSKDLYVLEKNILLKNKILKCINHFKDELKLNFKLKITTSWITKTLPEGFSQRHSHSLSFYSGVYYPINSENRYDIEFIKTKVDYWNLHSCVKEYDYINSDIKFSFPSNTLIIFNSSIEHRIPKNIINQDRYSLAFNIMPEGMIGDITTDSHYYFK